MSMKSLSSRSVRAADHASLRTLRARNPGPYILVPSLSSRESARPFTFSTQATASTMGNASPEPSSIASSAPKLAILDVMKQAWGCIVRNFWSMAFIFALCDLLQFGLHRISHRLTNEVSVMLFSGRGVSADAIGNMWWLSNDPTIMNFSTGYQPTSLVFFLLMFPINLLIRSLSFGAAVLALEREAAAPAVPADGTPAPKKKLFAGLREGVGRVWGLRGELAAMAKRIVWVELVVSLQAIPLQLLSLLVLPLYWTLPRLADLQMSTTVSVLEADKEGGKAVQRSKELAQGNRRAALAPVLLSLVISKALEFLNAYCFLNVAYFLERGVGELFFAVFLGFNLLNFIVVRIRDVAPYVAYKNITSPKPAAVIGAPSASGPAGEGGTGTAAAEDSVASSPRTPSPQL